MVLLGGHAWKYENKALGVDFGKYLIIKFRSLEFLFRQLNRSNTGLKYFYSKIHDYLALIVFRNTKLKISMDKMGPKR